jgi:hypothetical protein
MSNEVLDVVLEVIHDCLVRVELLNEWVHLEQRQFSTFNHELRKG